MSYRRHKLDANHADTVEYLRARGVSVQSLAMVGDDCPDLLWGYRGVNGVIELKDGSKPPSARQLSSGQKAWHAAWSGFVDVALSPEEAWLRVLYRCDE